MNRILYFTAPLVLAGGLYAQLPKDAEERHQMKYGRPSPAAEAKQREAAKAAHAKPAQPFHKLDTDGDGKLSREEFAAQERTTEACKVCCKQGGE